ncbi:hypothetical protein SAMN02745687_00932 [Lachnospiraceae bacterium NK3A20]|nr:hypothetical protein SAMN02745687_00932 [Lachnospiraceae bacterium NK3A20]
MKSIITGDTPDRCYICRREIGAGSRHLHHMIHGSMRNLAEKYGLTVHLCVDCHTKLHDHGKEDLRLERIAQEAFERKYSHGEWMQLFRKDFTEESKMPKNTEYCVTSCGNTQCVLNMENVGTAGMPVYRKDTGWCAGYQPVRKKAKKTKGGKR